MVGGSKTPCLMVGMVLQPNGGRQYNPASIRNGEYGLNSAQVVLAAWEHVHLEDMSLALGMTQDQKASLGCDPPFPDDHTFGNIYTFKYGNGPAQPPTSVTCHKEGITIPEEKYTDPSNTCAYNPYN